MPRSMPLWSVRRAAFRRSAPVSGLALGALLAAGQVADAQTTVGPSPPTITATVTVGSGTATVVGGTAIAVTGATDAARATGGLLTLDPATGFKAGQSITLQTLNGAGLQASGTGAIIAASGVGVLTQGGHALLANGPSSRITATGTAITTTGVGAGLVAIGGIIEATGVTINNNASASTTISNGHGAIAESGGPGACTPGPASPRRLSTPWAWVPLERTAWSAPTP